MSNSAQETPSAARRPSLMATDAASTSTSNTRVLADLGGQEPSSQRKGTVIALIAGLLVVAAGGFYWSNRGTNTEPAAPLVAATPPAPAATASATAEPPKPDETLAASAEPKSEAARVVADDSVSTALATAAPAAAAALSAVALPAAAPSKAKDEAKPTATTKASSPAHDKAAAPAAKTATAARDKASSSKLAAKNSEGNAKAAAAAGKRPDPDSDLLAAVLRRSGGPQPAAAPNPAVERAAQEKPGP